MSSLTKRQQESTTVLLYTYFVYLLVYPIYTLYGINDILLGPLGSMNISLYGPLFSFVFGSSHLLLSLCFSFPFSLPRPNSDLGQIRRLFSPVPTTVRAFISIARRLQPFLPSSARNELRPLKVADCLRTSPQTTVTTPHKSMYTAHRFLMSSTLYLYVY